MKRLISLLLVLIFILSACKTPVDDKNTLESSVIEENPKTEASYSLKTMGLYSMFFMDELPGNLTDEDLALIDQKVPIEFWGSNVKTGEFMLVTFVMMEQTRYTKLPAFVMVNPLSRIDIEGVFGENIEDITFGDVFRFIGVDNALMVGHTLYEDNRDGFIYTATSTTYEFPPILRYMRGIRHLSIGSEFETIEVVGWENLSQMTWLESIDILLGADYYRLIDWQALSALTNLRRINIEYISHHGTMTLPDIFDSFPYLEHLDLSGNPITKLPPSVYRLENLRYLIAEFAGLYYVSNDIGNLRNLEVLNLMTPLHEFPEGTTRLTNLRELHIGAGTYLDETTWETHMISQFTLPENIGDLVNLEIFHVQADVLNLPESIRYLQNITMSGHLLFAGSDDLTQQVREMIEAERERRAAES